MKRSTEPCLNFTGQIDWCGARINLYGLAGLVDNHGAVFAVFQVALQFQLQGRIEFAVDIV